MSDETAPDQQPADRTTGALILPDDVQTPEEFYIALNELRTAQGLSYTRITRHTQLTEGIVRSIFMGQFRPAPDTLERVMRALGISRTEIMHWFRALDLVIDIAALQPQAGTADAERAARRELSEAERRLTEANELTLPALWKATHARLDYYHEIATGQARQSFRNAQIAMAVGFVLLVVFAVLAILAQTTTGAIVTGALGATSAAFAAYLGRTFVRSQETAATHLRSYFDQPLEFSRYLAAERLLNGVERLDAGQRATITADVLRGILPAPKGDSDKPDAGTSEDK